MADLHAYAVTAEGSLEKLATGLAQQGADKGTIQAVSQMAAVCRQIVKALGKGQEQPAPAPPEPQQAPPQEQQPKNLSEASASLHSDMQESARKRGRY